MTETTQRKRRKPRLKPFIVGVANDLSEYASVRVFAPDAGEAEETVSEMLKGGELTQLEFERGDDREGPYACDVREEESDDQVEITIKDGQIIQPKPQAFKLQCPHCGYDGKEPSEHGGTFRLLSDTTIWREIVRVRPAKKAQPRTLVVEGLSDKYDEDHEKNDRLECRACLKEFDLPKDLPVDYI
jgi:hypothetical protein